MNGAIRARGARRPASAGRAAKRRFVVLGLLPIMLYFSVFSVYPIFSAMYISLHDWGLMSTEHLFVGISNYTRAFGDDVFFITIKNTLYFSVLNVTLGTVLGLLTAVFLNSLPKWSVPWLRGILFAPVVTSMVAVSLMFELLYEPSRGLFNYLLKFIGLGPFKFLSSSSQVIPSIVLTTVWKNLGYNMVLFIAGLTTIPQPLYEAAEIDGANKWRQFFLITLPLLKPTTLFVVVTALISSFQAFTQIYNMSGGGPGTASRTMVLHIYETAFRYFEMGRATAMAFVLFAMILIITIVQLKCFRSDIEY